jgi:hypothetical protein
MRQSDVCIRARRRPGQLDEGAIDKEFVVADINTNAWASRTGIRTHCVVHPATTQAARLIPR